MRRPLRVAISGGASAGKSTLLAETLEKHAGAVVGVAEIASELLCERPSYDPRDPKQREAFQTEVFRRQVAREREADSRAQANGSSIVIVDRGTIDGCAYWPHGVDAFWTAMGTSHAVELARYDVVFFLRSSARVGAYDTKSNAVRWDDAEEAVALEDRVHRLWLPHPRLHVIESQPDFSRKRAQFLNLLGTYV